MAQNDDSIIWAIKNGDLDQVKELIEQNGFNVNQQITTRAPIHYAADYGQTDVLRYLINKGADVNIRDKHGITPILAATWEGHTNCVQILLENGADKSVTTPDGTSLIDAAEKQEVKDLLQRYRKS